MSLSSSAEDDQLEPDFDSPYCSKNEADASTGASAHALVLL